MRRIVVAEIEPAVLDYAALCSSANHAVLEQREVEVRVGDARELLRTSRERFDLIASEPSNPYRAGVANLFTRELYDLAAQRLAPGGIFVQWLQAYEIDRASFETVLATFGSAFPSATIWQSKPGDLLLVGAREPREVDVDRLRERLRVEPYRSAFGAVAGIYDAEGVLALHLGDRRLVRGAAAINTDDQNLLEYGFARTLGDPSQGLLEAALHAEALALGADRPAVRGAVDWGLAARLRPRTAHVIGDPGHGFPVDDGDRWARFGALVERGAWAEAARTAASQAPPAHDLFLRAARVEALAWSLGSPADAAAVAALDREAAAIAEAGAGTGVDADAAWLRLAIALGAGLGEEVPARARAAFAAARASPWVPAPRIERVLDRLVGAGLPPEIAGPVAADLVEAPFALRQREQARRAAAQKLAIQARVSDLAARAFELDEPFPVWVEQPLTLRAQAYAAAGRKGLAERALADLDRYLKQPDETAR
jgi:hypothetical protein